MELDLAGNQIIIKSDPPSTFEADFNFRVSNPDGDIVETTDSIAISVKCDSSTNSLTEAPGIGGTVEVNQGYTDGSGNNQYLFEFDPFTYATDGGPCRVDNPGDVVYEIRSADT